MALAISHWKKSLAPHELVSYKYTYAFDHVDNRENIKRSEIVVLGSNTGPGLARATAMLTEKIEIIVECFRIFAKPESSLFWFCYECLPVI